MGEKSAESVVLYLKDERNKKLIKDLIKELHMESVEKKKEAVRLPVKAFVVTGTLSSLSREEASSLMREWWNKLRVRFPQKRATLWGGESRVKI